LILVSTEIIAGERQAEELGASLAAEMMFYAVASAVLANEILKHKRREQEEEELLEMEREEMLDQVNSLLRAMDRRGCMMEELETVVNLYRENLKDIKESEDSVDAIVNIHNANVKLIERALLDVTDTNFVNSSPSVTRWDVVQDSEGNLLQKQASEILDS